MLDSLQQFRILVWERDNPAVIAESAETHSDWAGLSWKFYNKQFSGNQQLEFYEEAKLTATGLRTGMVDGSGSTAWQYDSRGRMTQEIKTIDGTTYQTNWTYNSADMVTSMTYPIVGEGRTRETVNYSYLPQGLINSVIGSSTYVSSTIYDEAGRVDKRILGTTPANTTNYDYHPWTSNAAGTLKNLQTTNGSTYRQDLRYTYNLDGNITSIIDIMAGFQTQYFDYDSLHRLKNAYASGGTSGYYGSSTNPLDYTYDSNTGNLLSQETLDYTYGDTNHRHAVTYTDNGNEYSYDANGNMTGRHIEATDTDYVLAYDAENRLVSVTGSDGSSANFSYDGDGNRVKSVIVSGPTTTTYYVGNYAEKENGTAKSYYFAGSTRVAMRTGSETPKFLLSDHLGSTTVTLNTNGSKYSELRYYPWGTTRYTYGTTPTARQYTGQVNDSSVAGGIMYYNARFYDGALGRFISADTAVPGAGNPLAWDRYAYTFNSPINYTDPSGHETCTSDGECGNFVSVESEIRRYGILLDGDWTESAKQRILLELSRVGGMLGYFLGVAGDEATKFAFGREIIIERTSGEGPSCSTATGNVVCGTGTNDYILGLNGKGLIAHELGHIFDTISGNFFENRLKNTTISDPLNDDAFVSGYDPSIRGYRRTASGYATASYPDMQHPIDWAPDGPTANEDFADMFMNYSQMSFSNDGAGFARYMWMGFAMADYFGWPNNLGR